MVTLIGIADDIKGVAFSPFLKFGGQILAAVVLVRAGIYMDLLNCNPYVSMFVSMVWIVGITNSFNLLDNMNGLSSGIALICAAVFLLLLMVKGEFFITLLLSAIIGSTLGFFQFNLRGTIFLGDTGSLLLGFLLGAISLMARYVDSQDDSMFPVLAPLMILGLPLFDTFSVILIRLREGRPIFQGDQMHLSHRLVRIGMTKSQAVYFNYLMAFSISSTALFMINSRLLHSFLAIVLVGALVAMVSILMSIQIRTGNGNGRI
jgi:UDP-GlcNAc:undecaprenyl-phosphate GlcNAc-1-phosphate transferase